MFKILKNVILLLIVLLVLLVVFRNAVVKFALEYAVKDVLGLKLQITSVDIPVTKFAFGIKGLRLFNPEDFLDPLMIQIPESYLAYDLPAILKKNIHLQEFRVDLAEVTVIRDKKGNLNTDVFRKFVPAKEEKPASSGKETGPAGKDPVLRIDLLVMKIGKVTFKDYSKSEKVIVKEFVLNFDQRMTNVTDVNAAVQTFLVQALSQTDLIKMLGPEFKAVSVLFGQAIKSSRDLTTGTVTSTTNVFKSTIQGVTGVLNSPFQKDEGK